MVFTDHYSRLQYIHLMTRLTSQETINTKRAFEHFADQHGVKILYYHCDNGRFADNDFKTACSSANQRLTFCGVNAHFQNGIAEKAIRDLRESARKQLLHAHHRWPAANPTYLHNTLPVLDDGTSRLKMFSSIRVGMKLGNMHTFGCPVFALQNELSSGKTSPHWSPRARLGINSGPSPSHARLISTQDVYLRSSTADSMTSTKPSSTVGLMSAFLPFGNSWLALSHRLKDHPWNSTTSYEIKSSPFLATLQSLLLQATRQQSRKT